jgi:hypothetical protein
MKAALGRSSRGRLSVVLVVMLALVSWLVAASSAYPAVSRAITKGAGYLGVG